MLFNKKKKERMIDLTNPQNRSVVRLPKSEIKVPTNSEGFVELNNQMKGDNRKATTENKDFFGFMNSPAKTEDNFSTESDGYNKREVDTKVTELDNKIYKLEQRIELLERKLDVNQQQNNTGMIGW